MNDVSERDLEALKAGAAEPATIQRLIDAGLAMDDGAGGWMRTVKGIEACRAPEPEPLETVTLHFNYEPVALRRAGVEVGTSEGKAKIKQIIIEALEGYSNFFDGRDDIDSSEKLAVVVALLAEGP